jgi:putative peptidoglycan lipid II flippase
MTETPKRSVGQRMGIAAVVLAIGIFLSRILGLVRESVILYFHGATGLTDAYYAAFLLPNMMNYFLAGGTLSITFIPLFSSYLTRNDEEGGWRLFSTVATTMGLALVLFTALGLVLAPYVMPMLFPGFTEEQLAMVVLMTRIVFPAQLAFYVGGLIQATLFVREVFWPAAVSAPVYNICIILGGVLLGPWFGIVGFSVGVVIGAVLGPLLIPLWAARRHVKYRFRLAPRDPEFKHFILLTLPLMIGVSLVTVDEWLLNYFGSMQEQGAITWLSNSRKLMLVLFAIIGQAAGQAALPFLTRLYHEGKIDEMGQMLATSMQRLAFLSCLGSAGLIAIAQPIIYLLFRRGQFTAADADIMAVLLIFFAVGLVSWSAQTFLVRGFYAQKDTMTPMIIGTIVVVVVLPLYYGLAQAMGAVGLAIATTIGITVNTIATIVVYRMKKGVLPIRPMLAGLVRGVLYGLVTGGAAYGVYALVRPHVNLEAMVENLVLLVVMGIVYGGVLAAMIALFRPPELEMVVNKLRRRLRRSRTG